MPRKTQSTEITTRSDRERLSARSEPYWRGIEAGLAIGYRKGKTGTGTWLARLMEGTRYREEKIGRADDARGVKADGVQTFDFKQALAAANAWAARRRRIGAGLEPEVPRQPTKPLTVDEAIADYLAEYAARGGKSVKRTEQAVRAHILPPLGPIPVCQLTREKVRGWHRALAEAAPRVRAKTGKVATREFDQHDEDAKRRRRATANRVLTILKAALNHARTEGNVTCSDDAWALVKAFREADAPRIRYLLDDELVRLVNACESDFRDLVMAAALTGARYGELITMRAGAFDAQAGTLTIPRSKSGRARHIVLTDEGKRLFVHITAGKTADALTFERDHVQQQATKEAPARTRRAPWGKSHQARPMAAASAAAKIKPAASFHVLRHTYASRLARAGVPMAVIAEQLGHSDTRVTERHYAHLAPSYVSNTVRQGFSSLGIVDTNTVTTLRLGKIGP